MWNKNCLPFQSTRVQPLLSGVCFAQSLVFCVVFCRSFFVNLSFFFWLLCCLSFLDLRILIMGFGIFKLFLSVSSFLIKHDTEKLAMGNNPDNCCKLVLNQIKICITVLKTWVVQRIQFRNGWWIHYRVNLMNSQHTMNILHTILDYQYRINEA